MPLNPRTIPNNLRLQTFIEQELANAQALLASTPEDALLTSDLVNLALVYMEISDWDHVEKYASRALAAEDKSAQPSNENKATALYALASRKRELNFCDEALIDYQAATKLAASDWLKINLLRNIGLVHLKSQRFAEAADSFQQGFDLTFHSPNLELSRALPALSNYIALSLTRDALASNEDPKEGIAQFAMTSELYQSIFAIMDMQDSVNQRQSHDFISHCVHRGMILCETSEKLPSDADESNLQQAEKLLIEALRSRKENIADGVRLGDVCTWLGRVYVGLKKREEAKQFFNEALLHYRTVYADDAKQITDVNQRLTALTFTAGSISSLTAHGTFKTRPDDSSTGNVNVDTQPTAAAHPM